MAWIILHLKTQKKTQPLNDSPGIYDHRKKKKSKEKRLQWFKIWPSFSFLSSPHFLSYLLLRVSRTDPGSTSPWLQHKPHKHSYSQDFLIRRCQLVMPGEKGHSRACTAIAASQAASPTPFISTKHSSKGEKKNKQQFPNWM